MIRMFAKRLSQNLVITNTDQVLQGISLPSGTRLNNLKVDVSVIGSAFAEFSDAMMYACEVWILPVLDPDGSLTYDAIWDTLVPKDTDEVSAPGADVLDLDTGGTDTTPFFEPGEPDWSDLVEVGLRPERIYHRNKLLNLANGGSVNTVQDNQTPFAPVWLPGDSFTIRIKKNYAISQPSVLLVGIGIPALDDTVNVQHTVASEVEWGQLKYIGNVLERALLAVMGVMETGAETPWIEASALLKEHLEPDVFEATAGNFISQSLVVYAKGMYDHSVVGTLETGSISTGR